MRVIREVVRPALWRRIRDLLLILVISNSVPTFARSDQVAPFLGDYKIYEIKELEGGIISDAKIKAWVGSQLRMSADSFSVRNEKVLRPVYRLERIQLPVREGEIVSRDLTYFYGIGPDRKFVCRILVFRGANETEPLEQIEILDRDHLVDMYDGRAFFYKRQANGSSNSTLNC